jgi:hypothetical protein
MRASILILVALIASALAWVFHGEMQRQRIRADAVTEGASGVVVVAQTTAQPPPLPPPPAADPLDLAGRIKFLEAELQRERAQREEIDAFLKKSAELLRAERVRHNKDIWEAKKFMPEGVRQALLALNECLRQDGQDGLRFMRARSIEDFVLRDVELFDHDISSLSTKLYLAAEVTFHLDRSTAKLTIVLKSGSSRSPLGRNEFPATGEQLLLPLVDGPMWEERLPYLVQSKGQYPAPVASRVSGPLMSASARASWRRKLNVLLEIGGTAIRYRIDRLGGLVDGHFRDVVLLGYGKGKTLVASVEAESLTVHVDDTQGSVELRMAAGVVRQSLGETVIPATGYRIQLPGAKPAKAVEVMAGMVVRQ